MAAGSLQMQICLSVSLRTNYNRFSLKVFLTTGSVKIPEWKKRDEYIRRMKTGF